VAEGNIDAKTLRDMLERGERVTVLDVRKAEDYEEWTIPGSAHLDAYEALRAGDENAMEGANVPGEVTVVTVCNAGNSSAVAAEQLRMRGHAAVSLEGGMKAWSLAWNSAEVVVPGTDAGVLQVRRTGKG
jgi:rhodanese-related sulfurtransferase